MNSTKEGFASGDFDMNSLEDVMKKFPAATAPSQLYISGELIGQISSMPEISYLPLDEDKYRLMSSLPSIPMNLFGVPYYVFTGLPRPAPKKSIVHREPIPYGSSVGVWFAAAAVLAAVAFMAIAG